MVDKQSRMAYSIGETATQAGLGRDSIYEAKLFVRGKVASLGADCIEKEMADNYKAFLFEKLKAAGLAGNVDVSEFKRYGSARRLYNFHVDNAGAY